MTREPKVFTHEEVEDIAERAANRALHNLFKTLDVNAGDDGNMRKLRDDLRFLSEQREGTIILKQNIKKASIYLIGTAALGTVYLMWDIFKAGVLVWVQSIK